MPNDAAKVATIMQYLRRTNCANGVYNAQAIRDIAAAAYAEATEQVTFITTSSEAGGAATGQVTFDKALLLQACETLLLEIDPTNTPAPPPSGSLPDYSQTFTEV